MTKRFYNQQILIFGTLVNFAGNQLDTWRHDRVLTQWLSWPHIPIVSQGHYKSKMILLQDARLFKITWTLASAR